MFLKHNLYFSNISPVSNSAFRCLFLLTTLLFWASNSLITAQQAPKSHKTKQNKKSLAFLPPLTLAFLCFAQPIMQKHFKICVYNFLLVVDILNHLLLLLSCASSAFDALFPICKSFYVFLLIPLIITALETF